MKPNTKNDITRCARSCNNDPKMLKSAVVFSPQKSILPRTVLVILVLLFLSGCLRVPPEAITRRHWELNETIQQTQSEQLLLNIVRLRYGESPYFLQVANISSQFSAGQNVTISGTKTEGAPSVLAVGGGISYSESPVVTWSMPDSREFLGRLMAPMGADQLTVLAHSGYDARRIFRIGVKKMNSLRNVEFSTSEGVTIHEDYDNFLEVLQLIHDLRKDGLVDFAYGVKSSTGAGKIPLAKLDTRAIPEGLQYGLHFMTRDDPNVFEPLKLFKPLFLRFSKSSDEDPRTKRVRELLRLDDEKYSFGIVDAASSGREQLLAESGKLSQVFDPEARLSEIVLNNKSMLEVLYLASTYVNVPEKHTAGNYVRERTPPNTDWLNINVAAREPAQTWLKVKVYDHWFFIRDDDIRSRETFSLLDGIFASVVGNVPGATPLLTLPLR